MEVILCANGNVRYLDHEVLGDEPLYMETPYLEFCYIYSSQPSLLSRDLSLQRRLGLRCAVCELLMSCFIWIPCSFGYKAIVSVSTTIRSLFLIHLMRCHRSNSCLFACGVAQLH